MRTFDNKLIIKSISADEYNTCKTNLEEYY